MTTDSTNVTQLMAAKLMTMRKSLGLSRKDFLARMPDEYRITHQMFSRYERAGCELTFKRFYQFCEAGGMDPNDVLGLKPIQLTSEERAVILLVRGFNKLPPRIKKLASAHVHGLSKEFSDD